MRRWIVAMGGGGFSMDGQRSALDEHVLHLARTRRGLERPRICFVPTASGDSTEYVERFHLAFDAVAETSHLGLFDRTIADLGAHLGAQDALYVGGGNTASLLAIWRAHGLDRAIRVAHDDGVVLAGLSAGSLCWFESGTTDSYGPPLQPLTGALGLIAGSHSPHYDGEPERRPTYHDLVGSGRLAPGLAIDDHAAAVFDGPDLVEVVAAHEGPTAYRVEPDGQGGVRETALAARVLP
jgi:dipeptidase E